MESDSDHDIKITPTKIEEPTQFPLKLPEKSRKMHQRAYSLFIDWAEDKKVTSFSENILIDYFAELCEKFKCSTLRTHYSILKTTLSINNNMDIGKYSKLKAFVKRKSSDCKQDKPKKSKIFTPNEIDKFIKEAPDDIYLMMKVALVMGVMGACKRHELYQLKLTHLNDMGSAVLVTIPDTKAKLVRNFMITGHYYNVFKKYAALRPINVNDPWFFINYQRGKCTPQRTGLNKIGAMGREIANYLQLPNPELYSGHCFRRSSATIVVDDNGGITTLKRLGGCKYKTVDEEYSEESVKTESGITNQITNATIDIKDEPSTSSK